MMRRIRVIPVLLIRGNGLVKSVRFRDHNYIGDPINAVKVFNDKEVDELVLLDIDATREGRPPNFTLVNEIASEAFMPVSYGGGITSIDHVERLLRAGVEKVVINTAAHAQPRLITDAARRMGSQAVVASIDAKKGWFGGYSAVVASGTRSLKTPPDELARRYVEAGAGEIMLTSIDRDGTFSGYDVELVRKVVDSVPVPVVACGGARNVDDFIQAVGEGGASAVAAGSMFIYIGPRRAVLINFPGQAELKRLFAAA